MRKFFFLYLLIYAFTHLIVFSAYAQNTVLSQGNWYKVGVTKNGIHKIDGVFLRNAGFDPTSLNPKNLKIYGNGGGMLPQANKAFRYDDLQENAIFVSGENDGKFDTGDYILFYADSPHKIKADTAKKLLFHEQDVYSDTLFYFLTLAENPGLRVQDAPVFSGNASPVSVFEDYVFYEKELTNLFASGRLWLGERFDQAADQNFTFNLPGIISGSDLKITVSGAATTTESYGIPVTKFLVKQNGIFIDSLNFSSLFADKYFAYRGDLKAKTILSKATSENLQIGLAYNRNNSTLATGFLDFLGINASRELKLYGNQTNFRSFQSLKKPTGFNIGNASNTLQIWNISNPIRPRQQLFSLNGSNATFAVPPSDTLQEFVLFSGNTFEAPIPSGIIPNQNLHALPTPDLLIISPEGLWAEANRLADFRRNYEGLSVAVVSVSQVYNEFSSGKPDVSAVRDFVRFLYLKSNKLKYLLLFGDATYDYKSRYTQNFSDRKNVVPVYESRESLLLVATYSSDDYFAMLDENEGDWREDYRGDAALKIGIGRLPVQNLSEARDVVNKLIGYVQKPQALGKWRQQVSFVADDGDNNIHQGDAERLTEQLKREDLQFNSKKIFLDAFPQISTGNGEQVPDAKEALNDAVNKGSLLINFTGHGSEIGWTQEQILTLSQMQGWRNENNLPLFVTATCEYGRYDDPFRVSGAELILKNPKGGAIGLLTTTRPVSSSTNFVINNAFYKAAFEKINGNYPRLGDVIRNTKNESLSGVGNRNFALLGDPSMKLAYPKENIAIIKINGKNLSVADTLGALEKIVLEGEVQSQTGTKVADFNGTVFLTFLDKEVPATTLGQEGSKMTYSLQNRIVFEGKSEVKNGVFTTEFVLPKDIDYRFGKGKISLYAQPVSGLTDAGGYWQPIVGGSAKNFVTDNTPPQIKLFIDNKDFVSGGKTSENPLLLAELTDESGINLSKIGIGHEISAIVDAETTSAKTFILNDYFTPETGNFRAGSLAYIFKNLSDGKHTLTLKVWDTYNNSASASVDFVVVKSQNIQLSQVFAYPNPLTDATTFRFTHDRTGEDLEVNLEISDTQGKRLFAQKTEILGSDADYDGLVWKGENNSGEKLSAGLYIYRLHVRSLTTGIDAQHHGRLIVVK
ncbi:MAG: type IX secretion system sortase PorU [Verrucomicrobia bacterium]|nr:type IX secretion system sortase PorU [Cytophagales bacterium]